MRKTFKPKIWGHVAWKFFHIVALSYPFNPTPYEKKLYTTFFTAFGEILPCDVCKYNYAKYLRKFPISKYLSSPDELFNWTLLMHNEQRGKL